MHINDDHLDPDIDEGAVREVLEALTDLLEPRHPRLDFAQRVSEICMILVTEVWDADSPLNNWTGVPGHHRPDVRRD